ncbi:MAG: transglutaminase family protein [Candidatus Kapaibacterium sp.]
MQSLIADIDQPQPPVPSSQMDALLSLLDDPDPIVQRSIRARLMELGDLAAPALRHISSTADDDLARRNAEESLREIGRKKFRVEMGRLAVARDNEDDIDLEHGAFALALLRYPELKLSDYSQQLDTMASMLDDRLRGCDNGYMAVREINRYLVDQLGFRGCRRDDQSFYDPENSFMNRVLERRTGIPVTLSVIYILIGQRLQVPLFGVGIPTNYMVKYRSSHEEFYINPFNGGAILNYSDCRRYLRDVNIEFRQEYFEPVSNRKTVARMMRNLAEIYRKSERETTVELERSIIELLGGE